MNLDVFISITVKVAKVVTMAIVDVIVSIIIVVAVVVMMTVVIIVVFLAKKVDIVEDLGVYLILHVCK